VRGQCAPAGVFVETSSRVDVNIKAVPPGGAKSIGFGVDVLNLSSHQLRGVAQAGSDATISGSPRPIRTRT
jgi:hypothetical protein